MSTAVSNVSKSYNIAIVISSINTFCVSPLSVVFTTLSWGFRTGLMFVQEIRYANRNPIDNTVLHMLKDKSTNPSITINIGEYLYRARIIENPNATGKADPFWGYSKEDSFIPPCYATKDMRANYRYIPYLYCANSPNIALYEVRPRLNSLVSIAKIGINDKLEIFDFTLAKKPIGISPAKNYLCNDLSIMFSEPVLRDDDVLTYIPTQYIAEFIKRLGYDGIKYFSAYNRNDSQYANFVIFNYTRCEPIKSNIYQVHDIEIHSKKNDEDKDNELDIFESMKHPPMKGEMVMRRRKKHQRNNY